MSNEIVILTQKISSMVYFGTEIHNHTQHNSFPLTTKLVYSMNKQNQSSSSKTNAQDSRTGTSSTEKSQTMDKESSTTLASNISSKDKASETGTSSMKDIPNHRYRNHHL
jgi:hypothetical protein